ncbi:MAG TPA: class I SAM-dependent methyltransferase [Vicinamibacterales bacterium]|jgi:hypothetical protein|nr:class I SAM-dependent methyltransferase [Vicinamibacterales bacterium]
MFTPRHVRRTAVAVCLSFVAATASAQTTPKPYEPQSGQAGKDVVWVPTPQPLVEKMLDLAKVTPKDFVMDLGSGDGRTVIAAAKRGAHSMGVEFNPDMVTLSQNKVKEAGVADRAQIVQGDLFEADLSKATVITLFLLPQINEKLRPKILDLKPGTRIVSNSFTMGDWESDETATVTEDCTSWCTALFWMVPAKVDGTWTSPQGDLVLEQKYQMVTGTMSGKPIGNGRLRGDQLTFTVDGAQQTARVNGKTMQGSNWTATKK